MRAVSTVWANTDDAASVALMASATDTARPFGWFFMVVSSIFCMVVEISDAYPMFRFHPVSEFERFRRAPASSRFERALGLDIDGIDRGAARHEQPVPLLAAEAQIGAGLRQVDLADQLAGRRVTAHAVLLGIGPAHAAPDIAVDIGAHAVGESGREILGEHLVV